MKHDLRIILLLVTMFFFSQIIGITILFNDIDIEIAPTGEPVVVHSETVVGPRPETKGFESFALIGVSVILGTALILLIMMLRFRYILWKLLFLYAVFITIAIALGVFIQAETALLIALLLAIMKVFKPNPIIHNVTEVFMYAGITVLLVPIFNLLWITVLLLAISVYDFIAVFKVKHMIKMAKFQTESNVFAGLSLAYKSKMKRTRKKGAKIMQQKMNAILGGGDIAFPMMFAGVVLEAMISNNIEPAIALMKTFLLAFVVTISLLLLFIKGQRGKFYPAMPVLTAGCLIGLGLVWLL